MSRLIGRIDKLEADNGGNGPRLFTWLNEGETLADAEARYIAQHGPLPYRAELIAFQWQIEAPKN